MSDTTASDPTPADLALARALGDFKIEDLSLDQLATMRSKRFDRLQDAVVNKPTNKDEADALVALREEFDALDSHIKASEATAAEDAGVAAAVDAALDGLPDPAEVNPPAADAVVDPDVPADDAAPTPDAPDAAATDAPVEAGDRDLVLAAATLAKTLDTLLTRTAAGAVIPTGQAEGDQNVELVPEPGRPRLASADAPFTMTGGMGLPMGTQETLAEIVVNRLATLGPIPDNAAPGKTILAAASLGADESTMLRFGSARDNETLIRQSMEAHRERNRDVNNGDRKARLAALCAPATILRNPALAGTDDTPVSDQFTWLNSEGAANALSYQYRAPITMATPGDGIGVWSETDQSYVDPSNADTWKPIHEIDCPSYLDADAFELTAAWSIDDWTGKSSPGVEAEIAFNMRKLWSRYWDGAVLRALHLYATRLTYGSVVSAVPDVIAAILRTMTFATYTERLDRRDYTVILPPALAEILTISEARGAYSSDPYDSVEEVLAEIEHATGLATVQARDYPLATDGSLPSSPLGNPGTPGDGTTAGSATAIPHPDSDGTEKFTIQVVDTASLVPFQTDQVTLGQQVTLDQARQNSRGIFMGQFLGFMKPGIPPIYEVTLNVRAHGGKVGLITVADAVAA